MVNANIEIIKEELTKEEYALLVESQDYSAIAGLLNQKPLVPNLTPQAEVPRLPTIESIAALVTNEERFAIAETRTYDRILDAVRQNRIDWITGNLQTLLGGGILSQNSYDAIALKLQETQLDPSYQIQIQGQSKAELLGVYPVTASQVQEALN
jgi:hypothetical protein